MMMGICLDLIVIEYIEELTGNTQPWRPVIVMAAAK